MTTLLENTVSMTNQRKARRYLYDKNSIEVYYSIRCNDYR